MRHLNCRLVTSALSPAPCSALYSCLYRSSSVTRSTMMKRTCQKSLQPSKVSQSWLFHHPQKSWADCLMPGTQYSLAPQDWAVALFHPEPLPSWKNSRQGSQETWRRTCTLSLCHHGPSSLQVLAWPHPAPLPVELRLSPVCSCPPHLDPAHSRGPSTQSTLCEQSLPLPLHSGESREPLWRMDACVATVGQGGSFYPLNPSSTG
jgi:hypothetical protein